MHSERIMQLSIFKWGRFFFICYRYIILLDYIITFSFVFPRSDNEVGSMFKCSLPISKERVRCTAYTYCLIRDGQAEYEDTSPMGWLPSVFKSFTSRKLSRDIMDTEKGAHIYIKMHIHKDKFSSWNTSCLT